MDDDKPNTPQLLDANQIQTENTITFKRSHLYAVLLPLAFVAGLSVGYLFWGRTSDAPAASPTAAQGESGTQGGVPKVTRYDVPEDDDPAIGPDDAPITIIEFSDYECPYCRRWHVEVLPRLLETYPHEIRIVYRDFPLTSIHSNAVAAAMAANCANEQGEYWAYNERLFSMELGLSTEAYHQYGAEVGLDMDVFEECLDSNRYEDEVMADLEFASGFGVRSTPTFFINGIPVIGAQSFEVFQQIIDKELAGELE